MLHRHLALFLCGLPLLAGMLLLVTTLQQSVNAEAASDWNTTTGIVEVEMSHTRLGLFYTREMGPANIHDRIDRFHYRYRVDGRSYTSNQVGFGAIELVPHYHKGDKVMVYYDPHQPANSALVTGVGLGQFVAYAVAFSLIGAAVALWRRLMPSREDHNQYLRG